MVDSGLLEWMRRLRRIEREYIDYRGEHRQVSEDTVRRLLAAMGDDSSDERALHDRAVELETRGWRRVLPPVVVRRLARSRDVPVTLMHPRPERLVWKIALEDGATREGTLNPYELPIVEERNLGDLNYCRLSFGLPDDLPLGYHRLRLEMAHGELIGECRLIIAPERCYEPEAAARGERLWGLALQLYSLRSRRNWGIGDFSDLAWLAPRLATLGADVVGLNPLHALFPADPALNSPYSPTSRSHINTVYIDPQAIPEFAVCDAARRRVEDDRFQARLQALRDTDHVDYAGVYAAKDEILRLVFEQFEERAGEQRRTEFDQFVKNNGEELKKLALFYAIQGHFTASGRPGGWQAWPTAYQDPADDAVRAFENSHRSEIRYHMYLQWQAHEQLAAAEATAAAAGMKIGIYRDLAVGVNGGGAEAWADHELYTQAASIGAPPDPLALGGQDWGIPPMRPDVLRERGYQPFVDLLRANMGRRGALRIDHVMVLYRLWWVPEDRPSSAGAYVYYELDDLMGILALESQRHECLVIGEDLGTVPEAIRRAMPDYGVYSYRVFFFEREPDGRALGPQSYPRHALVTVSTHDLPPLNSFWHGTDIDLRDRLGLYPDESLRDSARTGRVAERRTILEALAVNDLLPVEILHDPGAAERMSPALSAAIQCYIARSNAAVMVVQPEDWLAMETPVNVPGTSDEHANWQRKLSEDMEDWLARPDIAELAARISAERGRR